MSEETIRPTDRDRDLATYWTDHVVLRVWIADIIAATRRAERFDCAKIADGIAELDKQESASDSARRVALAIRSVKE